jgi:signal transduction histidine kinase
VAGVGRGESLRGTRFPVAYSLTGEVIAAASTVRRADYDSEAPYVQPVQRHTDGGPAILTPLKANDLVLGVLTVWRDPAAPAFTARDEVRLRVIADHASLALWKARLFEEAQSANHAKNNFLATISHELRTPLTALTGYGELLADEILGPMPKQQQDVIERMRSVTQHLTAMIDEILTFSSLEAGREKVRTTMVSTGDLIRSTVDLLEPIAQQKGLPLHVSAPERAPLVRTDADKVRQILINLAGNAIKFTARGSVHLSLDNGGGSVRFSVRDTGVGISEEDQARLFKPFTQLDSGLTRQHGGTGLGLYISHRLATLLGGRIDVESVPGNGSTFTLVLPV